MGNTLFAGLGNGALAERIEMLLRVRRLPQIE